MTRDYILGFFDGEGCVSIVGNKVRIAISQTNEEVLNSIRNYFGFGTVNKLTKRKAHWKDAWLYRTTSNIQSLKFLVEMTSTITKKEKVFEAINILEKKLSERESIDKRKRESIRLVKTGISYRKVEKITGISRQTIYKIIKNEGVV